MTDGKSHFSVAVLIVGAGPVGLALAIELGLRGVNCLIVDETDGQIQVPTANYLNCRTVEFLRRWGIADEARYRSFKSDYPNNVLYLTGLNGHELARFERPANGASAARWSVSPEGPLWCPKAYFDPILRKKATAIPSVQLRFGCRLERFHQTHNGVVAELIDVASQRHEQITAEYLVGCDGGRSSVRHQLGIKLQGGFASHRQLLVWFKSPLLKHHQFGPAVLTWILKPDGIALLSALDGGETWRTGPWLSQEEVDRRTPEEWVRLIIGDGIPFEVLGSGYWGGHHAVAERYRQNRVFLAGDATHLLTPAGALGMNTGIGDAVDLGWKLAATLQGWAGAELLESYERERRAITLQNIAASSALHNADKHFEYSENLDADTEAGKQLQLTQLGKLLLESSRGLEFKTGIPGIVLGYSYDESPICISDGTPTQPLEPNAYTPSTRPGARAPHAWLAEGQSTLDLFGHGFTLLRLGNWVPDTALLEATAQECQLPLKVTALEQPEILELYERRLVLVRPDGHVAWRSDEMPARPKTILDQVRGVAPANRA
ncbi:MAG: FAD-dependent monooxygenase [Chroococcidiopsidaceae cyanobacterium CP_BM_ER_R8_30]|nr:FAD-dependent monooxygenase [Chroococcidiopsidaceae cyanobacterium CP_BM_ER_R8_30]